VLPTISVPTLVMYQARYGEGCLYLAERIPHAEVLERTELDTSIYGDPGVPGAVERFLSEGRVDSAPERVLTTVLFTDIVESTSRAAELGDSRWRALLDAHHANRGPHRRPDRGGGPTLRSARLEHRQGPRRRLRHGLRGVWER
jgi:hypothetical protein